MPAALLVASILTASLAVQSALAAPSPAETPWTVPYEQVRDAIAQSGGYDRLTTTNGARLQASVVLHLAHAAREARPDGPPLLLRHDDWFRALLEVTGIAADRAPTYVRLAYQNKQDMLVEYRPSRVIREVTRGPVPRLAVRVTISWPDGPGVPDEYSYEDTLSTPHLKVTNKRVITYGLLDYGDMIVFDGMEGLTGRPTTGALGVLFQVLGDGRIVEYRMAITPDGRQISRGRARKAFFEVAPTLTVRPDGTAQKGIPDDPAARAVAARLEAPLEVRYVN
jgi:hypothetical protein